jgi:tetratricopeptide (TPR) repeat protein
MKPTSILLAALGTLTFFLTPASAQTYRTELDLGVDAYKNNHFDEAIRHFRKATELDPTQTVARMYLATAYVSQYIPGVESKDNLLVAEQAIEQYQHVLESDAPANSKINSAKGMGYLYLNMKKFDEAKAYYQRASGLDSNDPEPYYSIGVIDWTACYGPRMEARERLKLPPEENLDPKNPAQKRVCDELRAKNLPAVEEGIDSLKQAIQLRPDYDDAMAYINLMYREKADVECDDLMARVQDLKTADHWVDKTLATKKARAKKEGTEPGLRLDAPTAPNPQ